MPANSTGSILDTGTIAYSTNTRTSMADSSSTKRFHSTIPQKLTIPPVPWADAAVSKEGGNIVTDRYRYA